MVVSIAYLATSLSDKEAPSSTLVQMLAWYVHADCPATPQLGVWPAFTLALHDVAELSWHMQGRDHTIYALAEGHVKFKYSRLTKRRTISVESLQQQQQQQQTALKKVQMQLP